MKVEELKELLHGEWLSGKVNKKKIKNIVIDSRKVEKDDVFLCIIGKTLDGHQYIKEAVQKRASVIIVSKKVDIKTSIPILLVKDTNHAYFELAKYHKKKINPKVIAVTGSVGKTTTKEIIAKFLETKYCVLKNEGNLNNHIGVPMTMLQLKPKHEVIVLEMGMNHLGEIKQLSLLAEPNTSIITNIGTSHIGYLKSMKNIFRAKMEIIEGMNQGTLIVPKKDRYLKKVKNIKSVQVIHVDSLSFHTKIKKEEEKMIVQLQYGSKEFQVLLPRCAEHLLNNIYLALQVGIIYQVPMENMINVLQNMSFQLPSRLEHIKINSYQTIINDTYNASFESTKASLEYLKKLSGTKCFIFGDILELGLKSKSIHKKLGKIFAKEKNIYYILIGKETKVMKKYLNNCLWFENIEEYKDYIMIHPLTENYILLKGSRKMHIEEVIEKIK